MDLKKLLFTLEESCLYFPNITELEDKLEGFLTLASVKKFKKIPNGVAPERREEIEKRIENNLKVMREVRFKLHASSWHMSEHESPLMWGKYAEKGGGIVIQSDYESLKSALQVTSEKILIGTIKYIDEEEDEMNWDDILDYALHKRKSYEPEKELRALIINSLSVKKGISVKVDIQRLVKKIYVSPETEQWVFDLVRKITGKYSLSPEIVEKSELSQPPPY